MSKVPDPDSLTPKHPASDVQDYLARKYASLHLHSKPTPHRTASRRIHREIPSAPSSPNSGSQHVANHDRQSPPRSSTAIRKINNIQRKPRERTHFFA